MQGSRALQNIEMFFFLCVMVRRAGVASGAQLKDPETDL